MCRLIGNNPWKAREISNVYSLLSSERVLSPDDEQERISIKLLLYQLLGSLVCENRDDEIQLSRKERFDEELTRSDPRIDDKPTALL